MDRSRQLQELLCIDSPNLDADSLKTFPAGILLKLSLEQSDKTKTVKANRKLNVQSEYLP